MSDWYLYVRTPDGNFCWKVGEPPLTEDVVNAARAHAGFPTHDNWFDDNSGFDIQYSPGDPHPDYLELHAPQMLDVGHLHKVDREAVTAHADARAQWYADRQVRAVKDALTSLDPAVLAAVLAHPEVAAAVAMATAEVP
jgi:hypothetical protein